MCPIGSILSRLIRLCMDNEFNLLVHSLKEVECILLVATGGLSESVGVVIGRGQSVLEAAIGG